MIYFASYFAPLHHHGLKVSISQSIPDGFKCDRHLDYLAPPKGTLEYWQKVLEERKPGLPTESDWELFKIGYRIHKKKVLSEFKEFLEFCEPHEDMTFLCWEKQDNWCHRNLVAKVVEKMFPHLYGGCDTASRIIPNAIGVGAKVTHTNNACRQSQWVGVVVWQDASKTFVDVQWNRPDIEEIMHQVYSGKSYNRINRPERFPVRLLKLV